MSECFGVDDVGKSNNLFKSRYVNILTPGEKERPKVGRQQESKIFEGCAELSIEKVDVSVFIYQLRKSTKAKGTKGKNRTKIRRKKENIPFTWNIVVKFDVNLPGTYRLCELTHKVRSLWSSPAGPLSKE